MNSPPGWNMNTIISGLALACTLIIAAIVFGEMRGQLDQNTKTIERLEGDNRTLFNMLNEIKSSTVRIETTLGILLPASVVNPPEGKAQ